MIEKLVYALIGTPSERRVKEFKPQLERANALEEQVKAMADGDFPRRTEELRARVAAARGSVGAHEDAAARRKVRQAVFDEILPEAFALCREAARRSIGLRHFDVQLLGGMVLHTGSIAEMRTGEGKTLVATAPAYLNALSGQGVHIVTVNDYLAKRDSEWMGPVYRFLGLSVASVQHDISNEDRRKAYACDITYVTNNEIGFDYLRDNMVVRAAERVMRPMHYAIVDEVDSILVDEARTPLIISGPAEESTDRYVIINRLIPHLQIRLITEEEEIQAKYSGEDLGKGWDAIVDEKNHSAVLTDQGIAKSEKLLGIENLYDDLSGAWVHHITQALRAHHLYGRDVEYVVKQGDNGPEVVIVDEFTGRLMPGRRWSEGLHQAVEAKEMIPPREENQTLATITFQNFFKMYEKLAGMTGTAMTEADEFQEIYKLGVVEMPTNRSNVRTDNPDIVYLNQRAKWAAVVADIEAQWRRSRPVLVGTRSIEKSEKLAAMLREKGVPHQVLNAKYHEMEATIIAQAGKKGTITIATNMAGRGTDIVLGGTPTDEADAKAVVAVGGLYVMGTERHEARRIDNQLRGRCGRQGDPGETRFYLALDDELMRLFGSERIQGLMARLGMTEDEPIESPLVTRQIEGAQRRVETHNFDIRKQLLDYDNVMNKQRENIYRLRNLILDGDDVHEHVGLMFDEEVEDIIDEHCPAERRAEQWDLDGLSVRLKRSFALDWDPAAGADAGRDALREGLLREVKARYASRSSEDFTGWNFADIEKMVLLQMIDTNWKGHLYDLDQTKKSIHLRAYGQKDPKIEFQKETFALFDAMRDHIREQTVEYLSRIQAPKRPPPPPPTSAIHPDAADPESSGEAAAPEPREQSPPPAAPARSPLYKTGLKPVVPKTIQKLGRNDPCFCGSGKKYKKCHAAQA